MSSDCSASNDRIQVHVDEIELRMLPGGASLVRREREREAVGAPRTTRRGDHAQNSRSARTTSSERIGRLPEDPAT